MRTCVCVCVFMYTRQRMIANINVINFTFMCLIERKIEIISMILLKSEQFNF
jgi:hypothetical protein